ncbi:hypothetical protein JTB14_035056 [Gonioctena quinquepunctata]|nr:hypothetical protein JTB14_035056 [Gonioctena quinquepunctata]
MWCQVWDKSTLNHCLNVRNVRLLIQADSPLPKRSQPSGLFHTPREIRDDDLPVSTGQNCFAISSLVWIRRAGSVKEVIRARAWAVLSPTSGYEWTTAGSQRTIKHRPDMLINRFTYTFTTITTGTYLHMRNGFRRYSWESERTCSDYFFFSGGNDNLREVVKRLYQFYCENYSAGK